MTDVVVGVVGGSGGVGASTFASLIASVALPSVLVDVDPAGGGVDVLLGIEAVPGARWSGLRLEGGRLDPALLADGLPRWRDVAVLAADGDVPTAAGALEVVDAATRLGAVVLDLPRSPSPVRDALLRRCVLCVVVAVAEVRDVAAARAVVRLAPDAPFGVVVRRGSLPVDDVARLLGAPLLGVLPALERDAPRSSRVPRAAIRVAAGVLDGLCVR